MGERDTAPGCGKFDPTRDPRWKKAPEPPVPEPDKLVHKLLIRAATFVPKTGQVECQWGCDIVLVHTEVTTDWSKVTCPDCEARRVVHMPSTHVVGQAPECPACDGCGRVPHPLEPELGDSVEECSGCGGTGRFDTD